MAFSFVLLTIYTTIFPFTTLAVVGTSIGWVGYYLYYRGLCEFEESKPIPSSLSIILYIILTISMFFGDSAGENPKLWRVVVGSLGVALISYIAFYVLIQRFSEFTLIRGFMAVTFGLMGLVWTSRIIWSLIDPPREIYSFRFIDSLTFFTQILFTISLTVGMIIMTTEKLQQQLRKQAATDALTGLLNRRAFYLASESIIKKAIRDNSAVTIAMIDLDHFKMINDTYGHTTGDIVLKKFADVAKKSLRDHDLIARYGGEEFILLFTGLNNDQATNVVKRLQNAFNKEVIDVNGKIVQTTLSVGISVWIDTHFDLEKGIQNADNALYHAKRNGRNRIEIF